MQRNTDWGMLSPNWYIYITPTIKVQGPLKKTEQKDYKTPKGQDMKSNN